MSFGTIFTRTRRSGDSIPQGVYVVIGRTEGGLVEIREKIGGRRYNVAGARVNSRQQLSNSLVFVDDRDSLRKAHEAEIMSLTDNFGSRSESALKKALISL